MITRTKAGLAALLVLTLTACGGGGEGGDDGDGDGQVKIAWLPGTEGRLYAAQALDLFEDVGLDAELIRFSDGPAMNGALQSGSVDVAYLGVPGALVAYNAGIDIKIVAIENEASGSYGLVVSPDGDITGIQDLPGKTIATTLGTTAWVGMMKAFEENGIDPSSVTVRNLKTSAMVPALERGDVEAVWSWAPHTFDLEEVGGKFIVTEKELGNVQQAPWIARTDWLESHPDEINQFLEVLDLATQAIDEKPDEVTAQMVEALGLDEDVAQKMLETIDFPTLEEQVDPSSPNSLTGEQIPENFASVTQILHEGGYADSALTPDEVSGLLAPEPIEKYLDSKN